MPTNPWLMIIVAGLLEVVWAVGLKKSDGFSHPLASWVTLVAMGGSIWLLAQAFKELPAGTGYAVWTGIGAVGTAIVGLVFLGESRSAIRIGCILLIVAGIVGLALTEQTQSGNDRGKSVDGGAQAVAGSPPGRV